MKNSNGVDIDMYLRFRGTDEPDVDVDLITSPEEVLTEVRKRRVKLIFFKKSGKYYTGKIIEVPYDMEVWDMCAGIKDFTLCDSYRDMPYVYLDAADEDDNKLYPCLVIREVTV